MTEPTTTSDSAQTLLEAGSDLLHAAQTKSAKEVEVLLKDKEAPVWYQDESGWSSLHYAAEREDLAMIKVLLKHGAVWNAGELCLPSFLPSFLPPPPA
jgi:protein arginine N-methyltransferase 2